MEYSEYPTATFSLKRARKMRIISVSSPNDRQTCTMQSQSIPLGEEVGRKVNCTMLGCTQTQAIRFKRKFWLAE